MAPLSIAGEAALRPVDHQSDHQLGQLRGEAQRLAAAAGLEDLALDAIAEPFLVEV